MTISNLKNCDLNCNVFSVYDYNGYTVQELLCEFFTKINECIDEVNSISELVNWLVNKGLEETVATQLGIWLADGTIESIINENLFNDLKGKITKLEKQVENIYVNIDDFPALPGEVDDTERIRRCINFCRLNNKIAYSSIKSYNISDTIEIDIDVNFSNATFNVTMNCNDTEAVRVGLTSSKKENLNIYLPSVINTKDDYTCKGITICNVYESRIYFEKIYGFNIGCHITAFGDYGCVYNQFFLKSNIDNKTSMLLEPLDNQGWVNQNTFYGGRLYNSYAMLQKFTEDDITYIKIKGSVEHTSNSNVFFNTCVESLKGIKIYCENGVYNMFLNCRYEGVAKKIKFINSMFNSIIGGYDCSELQIEDNRTRNLLLAPDLIKMRSSITSGIMELQNTSSDNNPCLVVKDVNNNKTLTLGVNNGVEIYKGGLTYPNYRINSNGLFLGDGSKQPDKRIRDYGENIRFENGNLESTNKYFILNGYYLWFDINGDLWRKKGKPTSDTDGQKIGSQG